MCVNCIVRQNDVRMWDHLVRPRREYGYIYEILIWFCVVLHQVADHVLRICSPILEKKRTKCVVVLQKISTFMKSFENNNNTNEVRGKCRMKRS